MSDVTRILWAIDQGDAQAAEQLLPLVYEELRRLAAQKLAQEKPGQTLEATALVHEAYLRLVDTEKAQNWDSRGHFFAAAAAGSSWGDSSSNFVRRRWPPPRQPPAAPPAARQPGHDRSTRRGAQTHAESTKRMWGILWASPPHRRRVTARMHIRRIPSAA
jgi:hypothetical protein